MERRLHTRHRARTTVYILLPDGQRRLCRAINLSATGVFIRTAGLGLRKGQQVSLAFAIDLGAVTKLHRRTAVVAHISGGGTGITWNNNLAVSGSITVATVPAPPTPVVNQAYAVGGTNFVFAISNVTGSATYNVLGATNLTMPMVWTPISTNFSTNASRPISVPISSTNSQNFFSAVTSL